MQPRLGWQERSGARRSSASSTPLPRRRRARRAPPHLSTSSARSSRFWRTPASSVTARTSARADCRSPPTPTSLEGGRNGAVVRPGNSADSLHRSSHSPAPSSRRCRRTKMPLRRAGDRADPAVDRSGRAETPTSAPAPQPWEAPLALAAPAYSAGTCGRSWSSPVDRFVGGYLAGRGVAEPRPISDAQFARRVYLDVWGLLPTPDELQAFVDDRRPASARRSSPRCSPTTRSTPSTGSRSGTICSATRTASPTSRRTPGARASPTGCSRRSRQTCRTTSSSRAC